MSSVPLPVRPAVLLAGILLSATTGAQPLCDVLLRPAFHYTTNGLSLVVSDSSRTYGLETEATWSFGDGTSSTSSPHHQFDGAGTYTVCLTLTATEAPFCSSTYCREVQVPLGGCSDDFLALFDHVGAGTNTNSFADLSTGASGGSWLWEFGDGFSSTEASPGHTWGLPGPHFVTLTRRNGTCTSTTGRWVEVDGNATTCGPGLFVDFIARPEAPFTVFHPNIVTSGVVPGFGVWSYGDGTIDSSFFGMHLYSDPGAYQVCLLVGALSQVGLDTCFSLVCRTMDLGQSATGVYGRPESSLVVWPNPSSGMVNCSWPAAMLPVALRVSDMTGRTVLEESHFSRPTTTLDMDGLSNGQYTIEAIFDHGHIVRSVQIIR